MRWQIEAGLQDATRFSQIRAGFYPPRGGYDGRRDSVLQVQALETKCQLPVYILSTAMLTEATLNDLPTNSELVIRLAYSAAFCRFVNSLIDPVAAGRDRSKADIAAEVKLPIGFIEVRNRATHEELPSAELLRHWCNSALEWLWTHFWSTAVVEDDKQLLRYVDIDLSDALDADESYVQSALQQIQKDLSSLSTDGKPNSKNKRKEATTLKAVNQKWKSLEASTSLQQIAAAMVKTQCTPEPTKYDAELNDYTDFATRYETWDAAIAMANCGQIKMSEFLAEQITSHIVTAPSCLDVQRCSSWLVHLRSIGELATIEDLIESAVRQCIVEFSTTRWEFFDFINSTCPHLTAKYIVLMDLARHGNEIKVSLSSGIDSKPKASVGEYTRLLEGMQSQLLEIKALASQDGAARNGMPLEGWKPTPTVLGL